MNKLLTIVIPTYNMESLLPRCLDSLVKPKCSTLLEVLVVNDGSTDNSLAVAKEYESKYYGIIKAIDKENGNYGSAVNKGIELASGKYFRILDSDDYYENHGLMDLLDKLSILDVDLVLTNYRRDRGNESVLFSSPKSECEKVLLFKEMDINKYPNFAMHGITYKTSILKNNNIRLQTGISYTDSEYCFYPLTFVETFTALDILVYCYQLGREGQTVDISSQIKSLTHMTRISDRMYESFNSNIFNRVAYDKQLKIFCDVVSLCFLTILCHDKSDMNINILENLMKKISNVSGAHEILMNKHKFGVKYYKRYATRKKKSNGVVYMWYYNMIRYLMPFLIILKRFYNTRMKI